MTNSNIIQTLRENQEKSRMRTAWGADPRTDISVIGTVQAVKAIWGQRTLKRGHQHKRSAMGEWCWRLWVRIDLGNGATLCGWVGSASVEAGLPAIKRGDRIMVENTKFMRPSSDYLGKQKENEYEIGTHSRELHGKVMKN